MATGPSETLRLFVAIELAEEVREALTRLQSELRRRSLDQLRWVRPEGIHLTLKFLGETPAARLPDIRQALTASVQGVPPHRLSLGSLGAFGSQRRPQVVWVDLVGDVSTMGRLQQQVEKALQAAGFPRENRAFAAHLTLARVRPESALALAPRIAEALTAVRPPEAEVEVREVSLMRSTLGSGGAVYDSLAVFALADLE